MYKLEKEEIGDWLIQILCLYHKLEIHDAFKQSKLNRDAKEQLELVYYLFKRANLKWRLFKRQALMMKTLNRRFKRPSSTRWVTHQSDAINAFLVNLSLLLGYLNNQIADPYNATMKKDVPRLQGVLSSCSNLVTLVFQAAKSDILNFIKPTSLVLLSTNLLFPEAVTTYSNKNQETSEQIRRKRDQCLARQITVSTLNSEFMLLIDFDTNGYSLGRSTRRDPVYNGVILHSGYTLSNGDIEKALEKVFQDLHLVLPA